MGYIRVSLRRTATDSGATRQAKISMLESSLAPENNNDMNLLIHALSAKMTKQDRETYVTFDYNFPIGL